MICTQYNDFINFLSRQLSCTPHSSLRGGLWYLQAKTKHTIYEYKYHTFMFVQHNTFMFIFIYHILCSSKSDLYNQKFLWFNNLTLHTEHKYQITGKSLEWKIILRSSNLVIHLRENNQSGKFFQDHISYRRRSKTIFLNITIADIGVTISPIAGMNRMITYQLYHPMFILYLYIHHLWCTYLYVQLYNVLLSQYSRSACLGDVGARVACWGTILQDL